jgi:hypothetical protein
MAIEPYADNFSYVVPVDDLVHTDERPFCSDQTCPCHEDELLTALVAQQVQDGLFTPQEAIAFIKGNGI